jgi:hypothetical protein
MLTSHGRLPGAGGTWRFLLASYSARAPARLLPNGTEVPDHTGVLAWTLYGQNVTVSVLPRPPLPDPPSSPVTRRRCTGGDSFQVIDATTGKQLTDDFFFRRNTIPDRSAIDRCGNRMGTSSLGVTART